MLESGDRAGHPTSSLKEYPGNISGFWSCSTDAPWPHPVETTVDSH